MGQGMKPGKELDAIVAEKVMGNIPPTTPPGAWPQEYNSWFDRLPQYSTDIAAAWTVVERLDLLRSDVEPKNDRMLTFSGGKWQIAVGTSGCPWEFVSGSIEGESAPHVICLAALKAVEK